MYKYTNQSINIHLKGNMQSSERKKTIINIILNNAIKSQKQLKAELLKKGYSVTQATLSRDLKELKVSKVSDEFGSYVYKTKYLTENPKEISLDMQYKQDLKRGFISLSFSANICLIKTISGHANSVASAIDNLCIKGIIGTVAGDDTIFALLEENANKNNIEQFFIDCKHNKRS